MIEFIQKTIFVFICISLFTFFFASKFIPQYEFSHIEKYDFGHGHIENIDIRYNKFTGKVEYYSKHWGYWRDHI